jgi:hypothetical protein
LYTLLSVAGQFALWEGVEPLLTAFGKSCCTTVFLRLAKD